MSTALGWDYLVSQARAVGYAEDVHEIFDDVPGYAPPLVPLVG